MKHNPQWMRYLFQKKMLLILLLGFVSGLPLGLTGTTLQAWYAVDGVSITTIGFLSLVGQPYVYKFLWSPVLDKYQLPFLGLRRGWMLVTQICLIGVLIVMAFSEPSTQPYHLALLAVCLAFFSATQDIAIDAYRTELLTPEERGLGTSMAVTGYRISMLVSGSLTLILAQYVGFSSTYLIMALLMGVGILTTLWAKEPVHYREAAPNFFKASVAPFKEFLSRRNAIALLVFVVIYKLGDVFANGLTTVFLLKGVGFTLLDVGITNKTVGLAGTLAGVFIGGIGMTKWGLFRALLVFGIIQAITHLMFLVLSLVGPNYGLMVTAIFVENFGGGLGTAAFMTLIMSLCKPPYTATQFALLSALTAVGRVFAGPAAGMLVERVGWSEFFVWTVFIAVPGLLLLCWLRKTIDQSQNDPTMLVAVNDPKMI
jgi:PAT family beta-lactamase induction signal transducer AmpG